MTTTHQTRSPSKAYRYLACPGSIREEAAYPEPPSGPGAIDGRGPAGVGPDQPSAHHDRLQPVDGRAPRRRQHAVLRRRHRLDHRPRQPAARRPLGHPGPPPRRRQRGVGRTDGTATALRVHASATSSWSGRKPLPGPIERCAPTTTPSASMTNVARTAPQYFLPYIDFSAQTP